MNPQGHHPAHSSGHPSGWSTREDRERIELEIDEEIQFHLAARAEALGQAGLPERDARRTALATFGNVRKIRRACLLQHQWKPIMLQRLHLTTTVLLLVAAAVLGARTVKAESDYDARLAKLSETVARLAAAPTDASASAGAKQGPKGPERVDLTKIAVGDKIFVADMNHGDLHVQCPVTYEGMILLPEVGWFEVAGKTLETIDAELDEAFAAHYPTPTRMVTSLIEASPTRATPDPTLTVAPGDHLRVLDEVHPDDVDFYFKVSPDGTVLMDQLGRISVAGMTRVDLELMLQERTSAFWTEEPVIRVTVIEASSGESQ